MRRLLAALAAVLLAPAAPALAAPADLVLTGARVWTVDAAHPTAEALAVKDGKLVYVGDAAGAKALIGPATRVENAGGRLVLPGLVDAHIHPVGIVDLDVCSLDSKPTSLDALPPFIQACIARYRIPAGQWVTVQQWNFSDGNQPSAANPTLRAALDHAASDHPIILLGNDGHHGAVNSAGLAQARDDSGKAVGYSAATLASTFADLRPDIGVDASGEPNGTVNEDARDRLGAPDNFTSAVPLLIQTPEKIPQRLNSVGITAFQDAMVPPGLLPLYDALLASGKLTARANLMQFYLPETYRRPDGSIDYDRLIGEAKAVRAKYAGGDLLRAPGVKIFADGVLEGNPYAEPPTLPDSPSIKPYLQPIFAKDADGKLAVTGYVDTDSALCAMVRGSPDKFASPAQAAAFKKTSGFLPAQCALSTGKFQHDPQVLKDYARAAHLAGFTLHIHAIGDAAVRLAVDAIEGARAADGKADTLDAIAHLQVVAPEEVARIGRDHIFTVYTYSWAIGDPAYDITVTPFFTKVSGNSFAAFHPADSYYEKAFYPAKATRDAGAPLAAGSDAPVGTRDPQPFVNIQAGVTRSLPPWPPANPWERLTVRDLVEAYTLTGARAMGRDSEFGSLAVGKSADFIVLDQDIFALADAGKADQISKTKVLATWFRGQKVYAAP